METLQINLNRDIVEEAALYARQKGLDLSSMIEDYLVRIVNSTKTERVGKNVPDVILSLLGAGEPVSDDDINGRKAFYKHLEEKYR